MAPASLEVSLAAFAQVERDRTALEKIWAQRLERADYDVDRARRRYRLTEPENRLVVRQLEAGPGRSLDQFIAWPCHADARMVWPEGTRRPSSGKRRRFFGAGRR
jgi:hypothetical protein